MSEILERRRSDLIPGPPIALDFLAYIEGKILAVVDLAIDRRQGLHSVLARKLEEVGDDATGSDIVARFNTTGFAQSTFGGLILISLSNYRAQLFLSLLEKDHKLEYTELVAEAEGNDRSPQEFVAEFIRLNEPVG